MYVPVLLLLFSFPLPFLVIFDSTLCVNVVRFFFFFFFWLFLVSAFLFLMVLLLVPSTLLYLMVYSCRRIGDRQPGEVCQVFSFQRSSLGWTLLKRRFRQATRLSRRQFFLAPIRVILEIISSTHLLFLHLSPIRPGDLCGTTSFILRPLMMSLEFIFECLSQFCAFGCPL